ncbi:hypothetical protein PFISCL1PPCAC_19867, partial [Pristionchus fissidentatus]
EATGAASPSRIQRTYYLSRLRHDGDEDVVESEHVKPESYGVATTSYDGPLEATPREDDLGHLPIRDHAKVYHHGHSWRVDKERSPMKEKTTKAPKEKKIKTPKSAAAAPSDQQTGKEHVYYIAKVPKDNEEDENAVSAEQPGQPHSSSARPLFGWLRSSGRTKRSDDQGAEQSPSDEYYALTTEKYDGPLDGLDRRDDLENLPLGIRVALPSPDKKKRGAGDVSDDDAEATGAAGPSRIQRTYYLSRLRHDGDEDVVESEHVKPESYGVATTSYDGPLEATPREDDLGHLPIRDHAKVYHHGQSWRVDKERSPMKEKTTKAPKEKKIKTPKSAAAAPSDQQTGKEHVYYIAKVPKDNEEDENAVSAGQPEQPHSSSALPLFGWLRSSGRTKRSDDQGAEQSPSDEYYALTTEKYDGPLDGLDRRDDLENLPLGIRVALPSPDKKKRGAGDVSDDDAEATGAASPSRIQRTYYLSRLRHDGDEDVVESEHVKPESYGVATTSYDGPLEATPREDDLGHLPIRDHAKVYHHGQSWRVDKERSPMKEKTTKAPKEKKIKTPKSAAAAPSDQQTGKEHVYYIAKVPKDNEEDENAVSAGHPEQPHSSSARPLFGWLRSSGRTKRSDDQGAEQSPSDEYYALTTEKYDGPLDGLDRRDDLENLPLGIRVALPSPDKKKRGAGDVSDDDAEATGAAGPSRIQRTYYLSRLRHDGDEDVVESEHVKPESYGVATTSYDGPLEATPREDDLGHLPIRDHAKVYHHGQSWRVDKERSPMKEKTTKAPKEKKIKTPKSAAAAPSDQQTGKEHVYYIAKVPKDNEEDENAVSAGHPEQPHSSSARPLFGWLRSSGRTKRSDDQGAEQSPSDEYYALTTEKYDGPLDGLDRRDDLENLPLGIRVALPSPDKKKRGAGDVSDDDAEATGAAGPSRIQRTYYLSRLRHDGDEDVVESEHVKPESYGVATTSYDGPLEATPREDDLGHLPIRDHAKVYHHGQSWRVDKERSPMKEKTTKAPKEKKIKTPKSAAAAPSDQQTGKEHVYYIAKVPKYNEEDENAVSAEQPGQPHSSSARPLFGWLRSSGRTKRSDDQGAEQSPSDEYYALTTEKYDGPLDGLDRRDDLENLPLGIRVALPSPDKKKRGAGDVSDDDAEATGAASPSRIQRTYYLSRLRHDGDEDVVESKHVKPESYGVATTSYDGPLEATPREDDLGHLPIRDHAKVYHHGQSWRVDKERSPMKEKTTKAPKEKKIKTPKSAAAAPSDQQTGKEHVYYIAKVPKDNEEDENAVSAEQPGQPHSSSARPLFGWLRSSGRTKRSDDQGAEQSPSDEYYALTTEKYDGPLDGLDRRDDLENLPLGIRVALPSPDKKKRGAGDVSDDDAEATGAASPSRIQRTYYLSRLRHDGDEDVVESKHVKPESYGVATTSYDGPLEATPREDDFGHLPIRDHAKVYHHGQSWRVDKERSPMKEKTTKAPKEKKIKTPKSAAAAPSDQQTGKEHVYYIAKVPKYNEEDENAVSAEQPGQPHSSSARPLFGWLRSSGRTKRSDDQGAEQSPSDEYYALTTEKYDGPLDGLDRRDDLENLPLGIRVALPSPDKKKRGAGDVSDDDAEATGAASPSRIQRTYYLSRLRHDGDEDVVESKHVKPESYGVATTSYDGPLEATPREDDLGHLPIRDHAKVYHHGQSWRVDKDRSPMKEKTAKAPKEKKIKTPKSAAAAPSDQQTGKEHVYYIAKVPKDNEEDENAVSAEQPGQPHSSSARPLFGWLRSSGRTKRSDDQGAEQSPSDEYYALTTEKYDGPLDGLDRRDDLENLPLGIRVALPSPDKKKRGAGDVSDDDAEATGAASPSRIQRTYYLSRLRHDGDEDVVESKHVKPESYGVATTSYDGPLEATPREDDLGHLPIRDHAKVYHHGQSWRVDKDRSPMKEKTAKAPKEKKIKTPKSAAAAPSDQQTGKEHVYYIAKVPKDNEEDENAVSAEQPGQPHSSSARPLFGWLRSSGRTKRSDDQGAEQSPSDEYYALTTEKYDGPLDGLDRRDDLENLPLGIRVALPSPDKKKRGAGDVSDDDAEATGAASPSRIQRTYYLSRLRHDGDEDVVESKHVKPESYGVATTSYDGPLEATPREDDLGHLPIRDHAKVYHHGQSWRVDKDRSPMKEKTAKAPKEKKIKTPKSAAAAPSDQQTGKEHVYYIAKVPKDNEEDENAVSAEQPGQPHSSSARPLFGWLRSSGRTKRSDDQGAEQSPSDEYYALTTEKYDGPLDGLDRRDDLENLPLGIRVALPSPDKKKRGAGDVSDDDAEATGAASPSRIQRTYYLSRLRHDGDEDVVESKHVKPESYGVATTSYDGPLEATPREDDLGHLPIRDHAKVYHHGQSWRVDKDRSPMKEKTAKAPKEKKIKTPKSAAAAPSDQQTGKEHVYYIAKVPKDNEEDENAVSAEQPGQPHSSSARPLFGWLRSSGRTKRSDDQGAEQSPSDEYYALTTEKYDGPLDGLDRRDDLENLPLGIRVALPSPDKKKRGAGDVSDDDAEATGAAGPSRIQRTYYLSRLRHDGDEDVVESEHVKPESYGVATTSYDGPLEATPREDDLGHLPIRDHAKVYHHGQSWRVDKERSPMKEKTTKAPKEKKIKTPKSAAAAPSGQQTGKEHVYYIAKVPKDNEEDENAVSAEQPGQPHSSSSRPLFGWLRSSGRTKRSDDQGAEQSPSDEYYALTTEKYDGPLDGLDRRDDLENLPLGIRVALPSPDKKKRGAGDVSDDDAEATGAAGPSRIQRTYYLSRLRHDGDEDVVESEHVKPESYGVATTSYDGPLEATPREDDLGHLPIRDHAKVYHHGQSWRVDKERSPMKEKTTKAPKEKKIKTPKSAAAAPSGQQTGKEHVYYIAKVPKDNEEDENAVSAEQPGQPHSSSSRPLFGWLRSSGRTKRSDDQGAEQSPSDEYYALTTEKYDGPLDGLDRRDDLENLPLGIRVALPSPDKKKRGAGDVSDDDAEATGAAGPSRIQRTYYLSRLRHDGDEDVVESEHVKPESYGVATTSYDGPLEATPREDDLGHLPIRDHAKVYHHGQSWRVDKERSPMKEKTTKAPKEKKIKTPKSAAAAPSGQQTGKEHVYYIAKVPKDNEEDENAVSAEQPGQPHSSSSRPLFGWLRSSGRTKRSDDQGAEQSPSDEYYALTTEKYDGSLDGLDRRDDLENLPLGIRVALPSPDKKKRGAGDVSDDDAEATGAAGPSRIQRTYYLSRLRHDGDEDVVESEHVKPESYGVATTSYDGPLEATPREDDLGHLPIRDHAKVYHHGQSWRVDKERSPMKEKTTKAPKEKKIKTPKSAAAAPSDQQTGKEHVYYIAKVPKDNEEDENAVSAEQPGQPHSSSARPLFGWLRSSGRTKRSDDQGAEQSPSDEYYALTTEKYDGPLDGLDRRDDLENLPLGIRVALPSPDKKKRGAGDVSDDDAEATGAAGPSRIQRTYYLSRLRHDGDEDVVESEHVKPESYGVATTSYDGPLEATPREDDLGHLPIRDHAKVYHHGQSWRVDKERSPMKEKTTKAPKEKKIKTPKSAAAAPSDQQTGKEHVYYIAKVPKDNEEDENAVSAEQPGQPHSSSSRPLFGWLRSSGRTKRSDDQGAEQSPSDEYYALTTEKYDGPLDGLDRRDDLEKISLGRVVPRHVLCDISNMDGEQSSRRAIRNVFFLRRRESEAQHRGPHGYTNGREMGPTEILAPEGEMKHLEMQREERLGVHLASVSIQMDRRMEVEFERVMVLAHSPSHESLTPFSFNPPFSMSRSDNEALDSKASSSFFARLFTRKLCLQDKKKTKKSKKEGKYSSHESSSDSTDENEHEMALPRENQMSCSCHSFTPSDAMGEVVREERHSHTYRLTGDGSVPHFTPKTSLQSLETTMFRCEALNSSIPHIALSERERSVRATAPLPLHFSEVGESRCTEASWKESSHDPEEVRDERDADGNL